MIKEYIEKNTAEMVRRLSELVAIPGVFEATPSKGAPFGKNIREISGVCPEYGAANGISGKKL